MRKLFISLSLILAIFLTSCADPAPQPSTLPEPDTSPTQSAEKTQFTLPYQPGASLHPITGNNRSNLMLASLVYEGLFELDRSFTPQGVLCASSSTDDGGFTWNFTLTDSVFSDGCAVTADAVIDSLELARSSEMYSARLSDILRISATSDTELTIVLSRPNANLPALLDIPVIRDIGDGSMPLGTGPYAFAEDSGPLRLVRQPSAPETAPAQISLFPFDAADDLIYAFDAKEVSMVISDLTGSNTLGYSSGYEAFDYPTTTMLYVGFRTSAGPCADALIRQALSRSFDRDTITGSLLAGHALATCLPFSPACSLYSLPHEQAGNYDPSAAEALFQQAGYTKDKDGLLCRYGSPLTLTLIVNTDNPFKLAIAEYLAEGLGEMGISVELKKLPWNDYLTALQYGQFDLYLGEVSLTGDFDLNPLLGTDGALNYGRYADASFRLLYEQLRTADNAASPDALTALLDRFQTDAPLAPLCFKSHSVLTQWQTVSGLNPTRQNPFYELESLRFNDVI